MADSRFWSAPDLLIVVSTELILKKLSDLRAELVDLAFTMDRRGHLDAADVAMTASARVGELCEEFGPDGWIQPPAAIGADESK